MHVGLFILRPAKCCSIGVSDDLVQTVGPGIGNAMAGDVREGEDVPVEQLVRDIYVHFEDGNGIGGKSSAGAGAGAGAALIWHSRPSGASQEPCSSVCLYR